MELKKKGYGQPPSSSFLLRVYSLTYLMLNPRQPKYARQSVGSVSSSRPTAKAALRMLLNKRNTDRETVARPLVMTTWYPYDVTLATK